jgi:hypothetical protein
MVAYIQCGGEVVEYLVDVLEILFHHAASPTDSEKKNLIQLKSFRRPCNNCTFGY